MGSQSSRCCSGDGIAPSEKVHVSNAPTPQRNTSKDAQGPKEKRRESSKETQMADPEQNLLVLALLVDFQGALRSKFRTRKMAFERLGGSDDARIEFQELHKFLESFGYPNAKLNQQLFKKLDVDNNGYISRLEFKALFDSEESTDMAEFKEMLREAFKSRRDAFEQLGGRNDGRISREEFSEFTRKYLGYADQGKIDKLFDKMDDNRDGSISAAEFKALFQPDGETAKVLEFKEALRHTFKTRQEAFDKLGGHDDAKIEREEFQNFLKNELKYDNVTLNDQLFNVIDDDNDGYITKPEFESLFLKHTAKVVELKGHIKDMLKEKFKTRKEAFNKLGGSDDARIDRKEFERFMRQDMGHNIPEDIEELFLWMDKDHDGSISKLEFKEFF